MYVYIYGVNKVVLAGNSPYLRSYTMYIHGHGQPYSLEMLDAQQ